MVLGDTSFGEALPSILSVARSNREENDGTAVLRMNIVLLSPITGEIPLGNAPTFHYNDRVNIVGLRQQVDLNGRLARVQQRNDLQPNRWNVTLESRSSPSTLSVHFSNLVIAKENPDIGQYVLLHNLKQRPELNGKSAHVQGTDLEDSSQVEIKTGNGERIYVPLHCTLMLPTNEGAGESMQTGHCVICLNDAASLKVADPCGHRAVCQECSAKFAAYEPCSVCRHPVSKYITVYE